VASRWRYRARGWLAYGIAAIQDTAGSLAQAKRIGLGTAATLGAIDISYAPRGRISKLYLLDALAEAAWILAWLSARPRRSSTRR
jgi:hypothetical protein